MFAEVVVGVSPLWLGAAAITSVLHVAALWMPCASNIYLPRFYFGLIVYSVRDVVGWRNPQHFFSVCCDFIISDLNGALNSPLAARHHEVWQTNLKCFFFHPAVGRYCMPVALIPLSCILISFLTVLISDRSASLCPICP